MPIFNSVDDLRISARSLAASPLVDFTGGLQLVTNPLDSEVIEACNVDFQPDGGFCRRKPVKAFGSELPAKPCGVCFFENRTGFGVPPFPRLFVPLEDGTVWSLVYEDDGSITTTGPFPIPQSESCYRCKQINFKPYFFDGEGCTVVFDGFTATELPWVTSPDYIEPDPANGVLGSTPNLGFPKAEFVEVHGGFAWAANVVDPVTGEERCNRLWRSYPLTDDGPGEQAWGENDWLDIDPGNDGDCITGIVSCGEQLYVFKTHSIYRIDGYNEDNLTVVPLCQDIGAANCDAIQCCDCRVWFFDARKGLHVLDDNGIRSAWTKVSSLLDDEEVNCDIVAETVRVGCCEGRVWVSLPSAGSDENDVTYVFDPALGANGTGAWTKYDIGFCAFGEVCPSENKVKASCLGVTTRCNHVVELEAEGDLDDFGCSTCPIYTKVQTRWFDGANPWVEKKWCTPEWIVEGNGQFTFTAITDYGVNQVSEKVSTAPVTAGFVLGQDVLCVAKLECLTPDSEPVRTNCKCGACAPLCAVEDTKSKLCGPQLETTTGCLMSLCIEGPADEWCVCGVLLLYLPEELRC